MAKIVIESSPPLAAELPFDLFQSLEKVVIELPPSDEMVIVPSPPPPEKVILVSPPPLRKAIVQSPPPPATAPPSDLFPPLENVTRPTIPTSEAAYYLNRKPQTLRAWACLENGPLRPVRINGRLGWTVSKIRALLNGEAK